MKGRDISMGRAIRTSIEGLLRTVRHVSNVTFVFSWIALTAGGAVVFSWLVLMPHVREFNALHHRMMAVTRGRDQSRMLRRDIERSVREIRAQEALVSNVALDNSDAQSIEERVIRIADQLRSARLHSVAVTRVPSPADQGEVSVVAEFQGAFDNVGIFLADMSGRAHLGLSLVEAEFAQHDGAQLSVRLSWSLRPITRQQSSCLDIADR